MLDRKSPIIPASRAGAYLSTTANDNPTPLGFSPMTPATECNKAFAEQILSGQAPRCQPAPCPEYTLVVSLKFADQDTEVETYEDVRTIETYNPHFLVVRLRGGYEHGLSLKNIINYVLTPNEN